MFNFGKKKEISVQINPRYCIWNVPLGDKVAPNSELIVDAGCIVTYVVNGQYSATFEPSSKKILINEKGMDISRIALVAANVKEAFEFCIGEGGMIFRDNELGVSAKVGTNADFKLQIRNPWKLYTMTGNRDLTAEDIKGFLQSKLQEILRDEISKQLQFNSYFTLTTQTRKISDKIAERIDEVTFEYGLKLVAGSFALANFMFDDEYLETRKRFEESAAANEIADGEIKTIRKRTKAELEAIGAIGEASKAKEQPANKKCPKCGVEVENGTNFCPKCGAKIN